LPVTKRRLVDKLLLRLGFEKVSQSRSHTFYRHEDGRITTLPSPRGRKLAPPLIKEILREIDMEKDDFIREMGGGE
jgi:predicted RNA binding protein YcfA (HicA-like mRNA interferase family)